MRKVWLLLMVLACLPFVSAVDIPNSSLNINELSVFEKYDCAKDYQEVVQSEIFGLPQIPLVREVLASVIAGFETGLNAINQPQIDVSVRNAYCANKVMMKRYYSDLNNMSARILAETGTLSDQVGLEDYYFQAEKDQILNNVNGAWIYVHLLFDLVIEVILIIFYFLQMSITIYILLVALPKSFLFVRDGITIFFVKRKRGG